MGGASVETKPPILSERKEGKTKTKDLNEADRKQTAPTHLPKWMILREEWMLQYRQDLPDRYNCDSSSLCVEN